MSDDKRAEGSQQAETPQEPADVNGRAEAIDETTDGDGVARFDVPAEDDAA